MSTYQSIVTPFKNGTSNSNFKTNFNIMNACYSYKFATKKLLQRGGTIWGLFKRLRTKWHSRLGQHMYQAG